MALPTNKIKKIKLPNSTEAYEIIPERLQNNGFEASLPTLSTNSTIALKSDIDNRVKKSGDLMSGNLNPATNKGASLGTSSLFWNNIYGTTLYENGTSLVDKYANKSHTHTKSQITDFSHTHSKSEVGLGNVDNTSDADKPVSNATQQALNLKANASDVYTKTETDGLLNDKANANDTNAGLNKSLYNLGAYDTISGNVITRQTGYVDLGDLNYTYHLISGDRHCFSTLVRDIVKPTSDDYVIDALSPIYKAVSQNANWVNLDMSILYRQSTGGAINEIVFINNSYSTVEEFKNAMRGSMLQYKLATPYTEEIIEGQPLITLDQQGSQWLRDEWEKGLNLCDAPIEIGDITATGDGSATDRSRTRGYIKVRPNTTYTICGYNGGTQLGGLNVFFYDGNKGYQSLLYGKTFTTSASIYYIRAYGDIMDSIMLNEGDHPYPYQPYNGKIVHDKDIADLYKQEYNLGYYDTMVENSDGTYTITRQTGYIDLGKLHWIYDPNNNQFYSNEIADAYNENNTWTPVVCNTYTYNIVDYNDLHTPHIRGFFDKRLYVVDETLNQNGELITGVIQYKLATATTEKVEKNHYATYNQTFILEHNKSEAERSANLFDDNGTNSIQYIGRFYTNDTSANYVLTPHENYNCFRIRVKQNKTYYIKEINGLILRFEDINNNLVGGLSLFSIGYGAFTTPNGCEYVVFSKQISLATNVTMLNEGTEPLPYQPYEGKIVHDKDIADLYKQEYNLGYYDTMVENADGSYTITRQTGYYVFSGTESWSLYGDSFWFVEKIRGLNSNALLLCSNGINAVCYNDNQIRVYLDKNPSITTSTDMNSVFSNGVALQYKLATPLTTEKVEKNHYSLYNQKFILEHNKSEAERSANVFNIDAINPNKTPYVEKISDTEFKATWANYVLFKTNFKENTQYTISGYTKEVNSAHGGRLAIHYTDNTSEECLVNYQTSYVYRTHTSQANKTINYISYGYETGDYYSYYKNLMINEGTIALLYQSYNQNKHITNNEADFLKTEHDKSANLMPLGTWTKGLGYTSNGGDNVSPDLNRYEDYISVLGNKEYSYRQNITTTSYAIVEYDINKNFIKRQVDIKTSFITSPNTRYIRVATYINGGCPLPTEYMLNEGSTPLPYQPYEGKVVHEKELGGYAKSIYGISQLYKHHIRFDITNGDGIECTFWSASNEKITLFSLIPQFAFSNIQVRNISTAKNLIVVQWNNDGFRFYEQDGLNELIGDMYDGVTAYYINGEPQL